MKLQFAGQKCYAEVGMVAVSLDCLIFIKMALVFVAVLCLSQRSKCSVLI